MVSFAGSEWSFAQQRLDPQMHSDDDLTSISAIVNDDKAFTITSKGWLIRALITEAGGSL